MSLMLRNLDDRRWADLVDEARALIPVHAPQWTDHNIHDPGITFIELLAWITEGDIYRINRIPDAHKRRFLALIGIRPKLPRPALAVISARLADGSEATELPEGSELVTNSGDGGAIAFRTLKPLSVVAGQIAAVLRTERDTDAVIDLTGMWRRGEVIRPFGADPRPGAAFYLGFDFPGGLAPDNAITIAFLTADARAGEREALREADEGDERSRLRHHDARLVWEVHAGGHWQAMAEEDVSDDTRAFTLDGRVMLRLPPGLAAQALPDGDESLIYVRVRWAGGAYDKAPELKGFDINGVAVEQARRVGMLSWNIDPTAEITGPTPEKGASIRLDLSLGDNEVISRLHAGGPEAPEFFVLDYGAPVGSDAGRLSVAAEQLGVGTGLAGQRFNVSTPAIADESLCVISVEPDGLVPWQARPDFLASARSEPHVVVDADEGVIAFGDGEHGRVPPRGARVLATYRATLGSAGNLPTMSAPGLAGGATNEALIADLDVALGRIGFAWLSAPAGGAMAETLDDAAARALERIEQTDRAVTLADYEMLALATPGTRIARAIARANAHPAFPCLKAPGVVTITIVPYLPAGRPMPSLALRRRVGAQLAARRLIGTRVMVAAPVYVEVAVKAKVRACPGISHAALAERVRAALDAFLDPLNGGPGGKGWPLGRDVYRIEVLQVIDTTEGTDHVLELALLDARGKASCGNLCVVPNGLVVAQAHQIEVV
jgi:hypothetical protein